jgi:hypothetical protein
MNERIRKLALETDAWCDQNWAGHKFYNIRWEEKFAELIVEECRTVVTEVYRNTPLELCGPLLTADEEIAKHFYGVEE